MCREKRNGGLLAVLFLLQTMTALPSTPASADAGDGWISGTVSAGFLEPVAGAKVSVNTPTPVTGTTDSSGKFNLSVPAGTYNVSVKAGGYYDGVQTGVKVTTGNTTTLTLLLTRVTGNLTGRVTDADDGTPISYASVTPEGYLLGGISDSDGRYTISGLSLGTTKLAVTAFGYDQLNATVAVTAGTVTKDFKLKMHSYIIIVVKGSGGKPLAGATVTLGNYTAATDATGMVTLEVAPGNYTMEITASGYSKASAQVQVPKGTIKTYEAAMRVPPVGGGPAMSMMAVVGVVAVVVVVVAVAAVVFVMKRKRGAPAQQPVGQYPAQSSYDPAAARLQKEREWSDYERMYGRPHPEASHSMLGGAAAQARQPKCPSCGGVPTFEMFSGMYYCEECKNRYQAGDVLKPPPAPEPTPPRQQVPPPPPQQFSPQQYPPQQPPPQQHYAPPPAQSQQYPPQQQYPQQPAPPPQYPPQQYASQQQPPPLPQQQYQPPPQYPPQQYPPRPPPGY